MKTILIIVVLTAIGLVGFGIAYSMVTTGGSGDAAVSSIAGDSLTVTIAGEINRPGTFVLSSGATMLDLITAASGTTSNADALAFNTDYVLENKGSYYIAPLYDNSNTCSASPITKTNINSDDAETLTAVAGFSKTVAKAIVSYRMTSTFRAIEEIKNVSGIGSATYIAVRDRITLRSGSAA